MPPTDLSVINVHAEIGEYSHVKNTVMHKMSSYNYGFWINEILTDLMYNVLNFLLNYHRCDIPTRKGKYVLYEK